MILCDTEIRAALDYGQIVIAPRPPDDYITTSAIDLTLGTRDFKRWKPQASGINITVDPSQTNWFA